MEEQTDLSPAGEWEKEAKKRSLDELFSSAKRYSSTQDYMQLMAFVSKFRRYSPFNAMLVQVQKPGAKYVLRAVEWAERYRRTIKPGAQPLVALQPMGPVMFLFDVSDTEGADLPRKVEAPFEPRSGKVGKQLETTLRNCARDGIRVHRVRHGSLRAGSVQRATGQLSLLDNPQLSFSNEEVPVNYELILNESMSREAQYGTLAHELGHLYCGHLGTPNSKWWPDRRGLDLRAREFEAESISYLVCKRLGVDTPSEEYLHGYLDKQDKVPAISLERVLVVSGLIEKMGGKKLPPRKN